MSSRGVHLRKLMVVLSIIRSFHIIYIDIIIVVNGTLFGRMPSDS